MRNWILLLAVLGGFALAQPDKVDDKLKPKQNQGGTVEVLVEMQTPNLPPGQARQAIVRGLKELLEGQKVKLKLRPIKGFWLNQSFLVRLPASQLDELARVPEVKRIYENRRVELPRAQPQGSTSATGSRWALERIGAPQLWAAGYKGQGVRIGHLDTGVDASHPALAGKVAAFARVDAQGNATPQSPTDTDQHGTHTAGLLVGNEIGVAPEARLVSALVLPGGSGTLAQVIGGMEWVIEQGVQVLSLSLGLQGTWPEFTEIVERVKSLGIVGVYAIGNYGPGSETTASPGNIPGVLGVGASDANDQVASFSSRGPVRWGYPFNTSVSKPDLVAPGVALSSSVPGGGYMAMSGTSMSTPVVAGGVALLLSGKPGSSGSALEQALLGSARSLGDANQAGRGLINLPAALQKLGGAVAQPPAPPPTTQPSKPSRVLLVDDDSGYTPDTSPNLEATLKSLGVPYDRHEVYRQGAVGLDKLKAYPLVLWILGEAWQDTLSGSDQQNLRAYVQQGGKLIVSGQDLGYDIGDGSFYREVLKAGLVADASGSNSLSGTGALGGGSYTLNSGDGLKNQYYPSAVQALAGAEPALLWTTAQLAAQSVDSDPRSERVKEKGNGGGKGKGKAKGQNKAQDKLDPAVLAQAGSSAAAGVLAPFGSGKVAYLSFGLEALPSDQRGRLLTGLFGWLLR